jgi:hypothetical protein
MRDADPAFLTALANAKTKSTVTPRFIYFKAKSRDETPAPYNVGFWNGDYTVNVPSIIDGETGELVSRVYVGVGITLRIPGIPRVSDLTVQTISVVMSQISPLSQALVRTNDIRLAKIDIHEGIIENGVLVSRPELTFLGEVDGEAIETPAAGGEGSLTIQVVSDAIRSLTIINPARRSQAFQRRRSGDNFGKFSSRVRNIKVQWGETTTT